MKTRFNFSKYPGYLVLLICLYLLPFASRAQNVDLFKMQDDQNKKEKKETKKSPVVLVVDPAHQLVLENGAGLHAHANTKPCSCLCLWCASGGALTSCVYLK